MDSKYIAMERGGGEGERFVVALVVDDSVIIDVFSSRIGTRRSLKQCRPLLCPF